MGSTLRIAGEILAIMFGSLLIAIGANTLLLPSELLAGGVVGICMIIYHFTGWSIGVQYFIYNIPLLILGYIHLGRKFIIYTLLAVGFDAILLHYIPIQLMWTDNIMLTSIFGGAISFAGGAIMLRVGGSNGGLDIIARVVAKHKNISIAKFGLMVNAVIVAISAMIFDVQAAMFTILALYVGAKTYEAMLNMAERSSVIIITEKGQEVSEALNQALHRGVTTWSAEGTYSHHEKQAILCVIVNIQWTELCHTVQTIDPNAFISAMPAHKIVGNFKNVW